MITPARRLFLDQYGAVRACEGRGADDPAWYWGLPSRDLSGRFSDQWRIRARTWRCFKRRVLPAIERRFDHPLRILDLGAGNCWMSWRLAARGHAPIALDIFTDARDGLRASRHFTALQSFGVIEAEFDAIPVADASIHVAIFNASFHYSADYEKTMAEVRRVLAPGGSVVIMDSPVYRRPEHGRRMVEERRARYQREFGFPSDAQHSIEFLDEPTLRRLSEIFGLRWRARTPWYGWRWYLRPLAAWLRRRRPPSRFRILIGEFQIAPTSAPP